MIPIDAIATPYTPIADSATVGNLAPIAKLISFTNTGPRVDNALITKLTIISNSCPPVNLTTISELGPTMKSAVRPEAAVTVKLAIHSKDTTRAKLAPCAELTTGFKSTMSSKPTSGCKLTTRRPRAYRWVFQHPIYDVLLSVYVRHD